MLARRFSLGEMLATSIELEADRLESVLQELLRCEERGDERGDENPSIQRALLAKRSIERT